MEKYYKCQVCKQEMINYAYHLKDACIECGSTEVVACSNERNKEITNEEVSVITEVITPQEAKIYARNVAADLLERKLDRLPFGVIKKKAIEDLITELRNTP